MNDPSGPVSRSRWDSAEPASPVEPPVNGRSLSDDSRTVLTRRRDQEKGHPRPWLPLEPKTAAIPMGRAPKVLVAVVRANPASGPGGQAPRFAVAAVAAAFVLPFWLSSALRALSQSDRNWTMPDVVSG